MSRHGQGEVKKKSHQVGRQLLIKANYWLETTFDGGQALVEDDIFGPKIVLTKDFVSIHIFGPNIIFKQKFLWTINLFGPNLVLDQKVLESTILLLKKISIKQFLGTKVCFHNWFNY